MSANRNQFYSWLTDHLKDKGWQFARSGSKLATLPEKHSVSAETGYWEDVNYSSSKPPRWLINFDTTTTPVTAYIPEGNRSDRIGQGNTAQGNVVGISARIIPVFKTDSGSFDLAEEWEWNILFLFPYPLPVGSSAETFEYDARSGSLHYKGDETSYMMASLLGLRTPSETMEINGKSISYNDATEALKQLLRVDPIGNARQPIPYFDLSDNGHDDLNKLKRLVETAFANAPPPPRDTASINDDETEDTDDLLNEDTFIEENKELLGIDPAVYRQINAALQSGKQHLMFYGPPGTGKTTLARWVATKLSNGEWNLITGSADWSSQDIIGGYQPVGDGKVAFIPGILLKSFDQPLIIDELNRCDIDKVLGPLFTVLSGQHTSLPYRTEINDPDSPSYVILPKPKATKADNEYAPGIRWRLIATINSIDKASLYQMSYALSRRFGWIYVDAPADTNGFIRDYLREIKGAEVNAEQSCPLAEIWNSINRIRVLGPAPFIDAINAVMAMDEAANFFGTPSTEMKGYLLDSFDMVILPLLDGILRHDAESLVQNMLSHLALQEGDPAYSRLKDRLLGVAV